jgi:hypothetical protein
MPQPTTNLPEASIVDVSDGSGGICLELRAEGETVATARAEPDTLDAMHEALGVTEEEIRTLLRERLAEYLRDGLERVTVSNLAFFEDEDQRLKFLADYTYRHFDTVRTGLVWYDVTSGETGPDDLPTVVRNKMRAYVHDELSERIREGDE